MTEQRSRRRFLCALGAAGAVGLAGCTGGNGNGGENGGTGDGGSGGTGAGTAGGGEESGTGSGSGSSGSLSGSMTVFHAGSLEAPFGDAEKQFESKYDVDVNREAKGSVGSTKKITELGRKADVLGVSDFRLIRDMMLSKFGDWYGIFTTNAMAIAYTRDSKYADEFSTDNWWKVLARDDVTFAHSDPAVDPNGYRSVMAMKLGAVPFQGETLFDESTSRTLIEKAKVPSGTETELLAQLESGELDYAWEYKSAGASHDVEVIDLQPQVNLAKATSKYAQHYAKAKVEAGGNTYSGAPIAYGITVPSVAQNSAAGAAWVEFMASRPGRKILKQNGFSPVKPVVVPEGGKQAVPQRVMAHAEARSNVGPLEL